MPTDYKKYPRDWKTEIRPAILARAGNRCQCCKVKNHAIGYRTPEKFCELAGELGTWVQIDGKLRKIMKIVLAIHPIAPDNTAVLCRKCYLSG